MVKNEFGNRLKVYREAAGFESAQQFAIALGMEPHAYRTYERGHRHPPIERLLEICAKLNITPNDLLPIRPQRRRECSAAVSSR